MNWSPDMGRTLRASCRGLAGLSWLVATVMSPVFAAPPVDEIATVQTLAELWRAKPIQLPDGGEVRLGLAPSGTDGGPWQLLYCLKKQTDAGTATKRGASREENRESLGPVRYTIELPSHLEGARQAKVARVLAQQFQPAGAGAQLHCGRVVTAYRGKYTVRVYSVADQLLAQKTFEVRSPRLGYWLELAEAGAMLPSPSAAVPSFDGERPMTVPAVDPRSLPAMDNLLPEMNLLPGGIPSAWTNGQELPARAGEPKYPLYLSMENGELVIQSVAVDLEDAPVKQAFLARWWLNGQVVLPARDREAAPLFSQSEKLQQRQAVRAGTLTEKRLRFTLPRLFESLRNGDRIRLQVLYCSHGYALLAEAASGLSDERKLSVLTGRFLGPWLSNPLEFLVTDADPQSPQVKVRPGSPPPLPPGTVHGNPGQPASTNSAHNRR